MPDYKNSKIYIIKSKNTDKTYVGLTTKKRITDRFSQHKWAYKQIVKGKPSECNYMSKELLKHGDCWVELLEEYPCENKYEIKKRENYWINQYDTINKIRFVEDTEEEHNNMYEKRNANKIFRDCECGGRFQNIAYDINRHHDTKKHQKYLEIIHHKKDQ